MSVSALAKDDAVGSLLRRAEAVGWRVTLTNNNHFRVCPKDRSQRAFVVSGRPKDQHTRLNIEKSFTRAGLEADEVLAAGRTVKFEPQPPARAPDKAVEPAPAHRPTRRPRAKPGGTRRDVLALLKTGPATSRELADTLGIDTSTVSYHLRMLRGKVCKIGTRDGAPVYDAARRTRAEGPFGVGSVPTGRGTVPTKPTKPEQPATTPARAETLVAERAALSAAVSAGQKRLSEIDEQIAREREALSRLLGLLGHE